MKLNGIWPWWQFSFQFSFRNQKEKYHHDHIRFNLKRNGNIVFSVHSPSLPKNYHSFPIHTCILPIERPCYLIYVIVEQLEHFFIALLINYYYCFAYWLTYFPSRPGIHIKIYVSYVIHIFHMSHIYIYIYINHLHCLEWRVFERTVFQFLFKILTAFHICLLLIFQIVIVL